MSDWTTADSEALYQIPGWGLGMFRVSAEGHIMMTPDGDEKGGTIDLPRLVEDMRARGHELPILVRFTDLIRRRIDRLVDAFERAIQEWEYAGRYRPVFPVKVNPQSHVMHDVMAHGLRHHVGLEAGSKPELMAVLAELEDTEALIICNGYKDEAFIRMALLAQRLGHECILVLEKPDEVDTVLRVSDELGIKPLIGVRAKLNASGVGRWKSSSGERAKFGLTIPELLTVVSKLRAAERLDCLQLLHFHIGSQVSQVRRFRGAVREATRIFAELQRLGANMRLLDVGGGLGIDYDGSASSEPTSINYDLREYAHAVIGTVHEVCLEAGARPPDIVTESGRAMVAHHSVLLVEVVGATGDPPPVPARPEPDTTPTRQVRTAWEIVDDLHPDRLVEALHDVQALRRDVVSRFDLGLLDLEQRAYVEQMCTTISHRILALATPDDSDEVEQLRQSMARTYFCNFSVFQSLPDVWAIDQIFPIVPIHRLDEEPTEKAILADLTCDSDGKVDGFIGEREVSPFLPLHKLQDEERYVLGVFLVGAYQEILGDLHNLFGDTHAIHVAVARNKRGYKILHIDEGEIIEEVLGYVHHNRDTLVRSLRDKIEAATESGHMPIKAGAALIKTFREGLDDYTYLSR